MENSHQIQLPANNTILVADDQELDYWFKEFGISKDELTEAVKSGLTSTAAVENYVRRVQFA